MVLLRNVASLAIDGLSCLMASIRGCGSFSQVVFASHRWSLGLIGFTSELCVSLELWLRFLQLWLLFSMASIRWVGSLFDHGFAQRS